MKRDLITHPRLRELLDYDPSTGVFRWRVNVGQLRVGDVAGAVRKLGGYRIKVDKQEYSGGRLAWYWMHGRYPRGDVVFINGDQCDLRFANLRELPHGHRRLGENPGADDRQAIRDMLTYEPESGLLRWRHSCGPCAAGDVAGSYCWIGVRGQRYPMDRVCWLLAHGEWPDGRIRHVNGNRRDNRLVNLRLVKKQTRTRAEVRHGAGQGAPVQPPSLETMAVMLRQLATIVEQLVAVKEARNA